MQIYIIIPIVQGIFLKIKEIDEYGKSISTPAVVGIGKELITGL